MLLVTMHHIVSDGWSMGVLVRELGALYEAFALGQPSPLSPLPIQYADYALWQRELLQGARLEAELGYWKRQLAGLGALSLPTDRPRPPQPSFRGGRVGLELGAERTAGLEALSQAQGVTLYMTLLGAFAALLARYSGQGDIAIGTPIAGRTAAESEGLIGFFVNTLVMRVEVGGEQTFEQLLGGVKEVSLGAYGHQQVPFEKVVEALAPERDLSRSPLFQVMFVLQNAPVPALRAAADAATPSPIERRDDASST